MEKISRRSVIGVAAGAVAGGVLAGDAVAALGESAEGKQKSEPTETSQRVFIGRKKGKTTEGTQKTKAK